jgi:hypothetical protein
MLATIVVSPMEYAGLGLMTVGICAWWMWVRKMFDS